MGGDKVILITQYYKIINDDIEYRDKRQQEIDYCLQKNYVNKYIDEIHLILEEDYDFSFIENKTDITVVKNITGKRINFKDVFSYCNEKLEGCICILINSDIYLDESIEIVKNIDFNIGPLFISLNRYENDSDELPSLLHGLEIDDATFKNCEVFLKPFQPSIWSQDAWIWRGPIANIDDRFDFSLGTVGCDNYMNYLMHDIGYNLLNCSNIICANHYDRLSIIHTPFGISKGNISSKQNNKLGDMSSYLFLENQQEIPDKYTTKIENKFIDNKTAKINYLFMQKNISEILLNDSQIIATSFLNSSYSPDQVIFDASYCWIPDSSDTESFIQFNFENEYDIIVIDIAGKPLNRNELECGYITKFKIAYCNANNKKYVLDHHIYTGIENNNGNYIKKIYLNKKKKCTGIRIYPLEYVNKPALKIKFYKIDYPKKDIFKYICDNPQKFEQFNETIFDYEYINNHSFTEAVFQYKTNLLGENISEGICLFTYVMNRDENIYNNISSWLKQSVDQIIILDWNSKTNLSDYLQQIDDDRILYVRVNNEDHFIRTFAQNLAARFCKFDKIIKIDSDIILSDHFFENHPMKEGEFYVGDYRCGRDDNEKYLHGNVYLFLNDYFNVNGYNEYIKNYGWDDSDFTIRLMLTGLTKKIFNYNYLYHTPHCEDKRIVNLNKPMNSMLMTFTNKYSLQNIIWNRNFTLQQYDIDIVNKNYIVCNRIKNDEYEIDKKLYDEAHTKAIKLLKSWKTL